ncbi:MAG TPA: metallophosphoesterase [Mycobacteriales bacterium]|nr:metallophosphoesterase [Mycobacteriales bacterium]
MGWFGAMAAAFRAWLGRLPIWPARWTGRIAIAVVGGMCGLLLGSHITHDVGPYQARISLSPTTRGGAIIGVPPLGALSFHMYDVPIRLQVDLRQLRQAEAEQLLRDPNRLDNVGAEAADDVKDAVTWLVVQGVLAGLVGAALLSTVVYRRAREPAICTGLTILLFGGMAGVGALTWNADGVREPRYTGLLANAPAVVGDARDIVSRFDIYQRQLADLITNTSKLYSAVSTLPDYQPDDSTVRVLHVSDLHLNPSAFRVIASVRKQFKANFIIDTGDLTDFGTEPESRYINQIARLKVPYVFIRGNHDSRFTAQAVERQPNAIVLNASKPVTVGGLTIVGQRDPRFTPDKETRDDTASDAKVRSAGEDLVKLIDTMKEPPDIALVHDPASAEPLEDKVPLVLAGHLHERKEYHLGKTEVLVEGSTGGAGRRGVEHEKPTPLECSVLYFDKETQRLEAHDDITLGGLGETEATIERHIVKQP